METSIETKKFRGEIDESYPELFTKLPQNQPPTGKPGQLTPDQLDHFFKEVSLFLL